jgi:hypothetical protein
LIEQETLASVLKKAWAMTKFKIQNIWHSGLGFDLAFELGVLAFDPYAKPDKPSLMKQRF